MYKIVYKQIVILKEKNKRLVRVIDIIDFFESRQLAITSISLPKEEDLAAFIRFLDMICFQDNLKIVSIEPQDQIEVDTKILPINVMLKGDFHKIIDILDKINNYPRPLKITKLDLTNPSGDKESQKKDWTLSIDVNLYYKP